MPALAQDLGVSLDEALKQHRSGRLDEAERCYLALLVEAPHVDGLYDLLGLIAHQRDRRGEARQWLRRALCLAPGRAKNWRDFSLVADGAAGIAACRATSVEPDVAAHWFAFDRIVSGGRRGLRRGLALAPDAGGEWGRYGDGELGRGAAARAVVLTRRAAAIAGRSVLIDFFQVASAPSSDGCRVQPTRLVLDDGEVAISPYCRPLSEATVTEDFLVLPTAGEVIVDGLVPDPADPLQLLRGMVAIGPRHALIQRGRSRKVNRAILLGGSRNYYHWLIEHLPRLALFDPEDDRQLIVNADLAPFQLDSLLHLGIAEQRLIKLDAGEWAAVTDLILPSLLARSSLVHPVAVGWLRQHFLLEKASFARFGRIYVSRRRATRRRLVDETSTIDLLQKAGVAVVETEGLPVIEQAALFASADLIVASHGAALANLVFATTGCRVIEIDAEGSKRSFFSALAAMNGLEYRRVAGRPVLPHELQHSDIVLGDQGLQSLAALL